MAFDNKLIPTIAPNLPLAPPEYSALTQDKFSNALRLYFNTIDSFTRAVVVPAYGTTANRPNKGLSIGQTYFDTTLGIPIWYNGTNWVNSSGTTV
jgi:hypothetical protein